MQDKIDAKTNFTGTFVMAPRGGVSDKRTTETIKVFLDKIDIENDADRFKAECLDLSSEQFANYCKELTDSNRKRAILGDQALKAILIETFKTDQEMFNLFYTEFTDQEFKAMVIAQQKIAKRVLSTDDIAKVFAGILGTITINQEMVDVIKALKAAEKSYFDDFIEENIEEASNSNAIWINIINLLRGGNERGLADYVLSKVPSTNQTAIEGSLV